MDELKQELVNCDYKNTSFFTFEGKEFFAKCIKVYDGDTITLAFKPFDNVSKIYKYNVRLNGIDTPEIKSNNADEKKIAIEIRDMLRENILNKMVYIKCGTFDKYGRLLGDIFSEDKKIYFNELLVKNHYAYKYDGGKKHKYK